MIEARSESLQPSLEHLIETEDVGLEVFHPGGRELTLEVARACGVGEGITVLDVACGTGESACLLCEELGATVIGLDATEPMIERAVTKARRRSLPVRFLRGDAHRLPCRDATFDVVISECALSLFDKETALGEMVRVTQPGGYVGIHEICWKDSAPQQLKHRLAELEGERPETLDGWRRLLKRSGLRETRVFDRSALLAPWMREGRKRLGLGGRVRVLQRVLRRWGLSGLRRILGSERLLRSRHLGYALAVGRKP